MLKNYIKTALRTIFRNRLHTAINILGLSLGVACSMVLFLLVHYAVSYDDFQENYSNIYRVVSASRGQGDQTDYTPGVPIPLPDALRQDFPEVQEVVFTRNHHGESLFTIHPDEEQPQYFELNDTRIVYTATNYFKVFTTGWLRGNEQIALNNPNAVVLSESVADKFFPKEEALGKTIILNKNIQLQITGIVQDPPPNTDMPFKIFVSLPTIQEEIKNNGWNSVSSDDQCYLLLNKGDNPKKYESSLSGFVKKYFGHDNDDNRVLTLQPMSDLHFSDRWSNYSYKTVGKDELVAMLVIGVFMLLTACVNFINLSTAVAVRRSREVGIRKVLGGTRNQLIRQFLAESLATITVSVLIGLCLAELMLIYMNPFLEVSLKIDLSDPQFLILLAAGILIITVLAGFYPAMVLSKFKPSQALKNIMNAQSSGRISLRKGLVVFQFFISQFFIIGTIITMSQMQYLLNADLGFQTKALINLRIPEDNPLKKKTLKTELQRISGVEEVSLLFSNPTSGSVSVSNFKVEDNPEDFYTSMKFIDEDYIDIYGIKLLAGRSVRASDTLREVVVNEKLLKYIGHEGTPQDAIGKQVTVWGKHVPIVGVVKDFHSMSLHEDVMTIMMFNHMEAYRMATLKVNMNDFASTNNQVKAAWKNIYPEFDYEYTFLDDQMREFYEGEQKMTTTFVFFSIVAILIGCLGLFGLASFMVNQKVKEIGVRKVLGATASNIVGMFSRSFFLLIMIAFLLAAPIAWWVMNGWLDNFQYKVQLGPVYFMSGLLVTLVIATLTVGYKSLRAATANPIDSLRDE